MTTKQEINAAFDYLVAEIEEQRQVLLEKLVVPEPLPPIDVPTVVITNYTLAEHALIIDYSGTGDTYKWVVNGIEGEDTPPQLVIEQGSPLAAGIDFTKGIITAMVTPIKNNVVGMPTYFLVEVETKAPPTSLYLSGLRISGNRTEVVLEDKHGSGKYGTPHDSQGAGMNCELDLFLDHGGNLYDDEGRWIRRTPLTGGYQWRQWDESNPEILYGYDGNDRFVKYNASNGNVNTVFNLARVRLRWPKVTKIWAGRYEGAALAQGKVYFQCLEEGNGYVCSYDLASEDFTRYIPGIDFNYRIGEPDFGGVDPLGNYFVKVVRQQTDNTKTPWWIRNKDGQTTLRSKSTFLGHSCGIVTEEGGKDVGGIYVIGGTIVSNDTGETLAELRQGNLTEHVGPVFYKGAKFAVWDDTKGNIYVTQCFGEFKTTRLVGDAKEGSMDYHCAGATDTEFKLLYQRNNGDRVVVTF